MNVTEGVFYTRKVAEEVGSMIKYMIEYPDDDRFFQLQLVRYHKGRAEEEWTELIRPLPAEDRVLTLRDGGECVRCITKSGRHLNLLFGNVAERAIEPVAVLLEIET